MTARPSIIVRVRTSRTVDRCISHTSVFVMNGMVIEDWGSPYDSWMTASQSSSRSFTSPFVDGGTQISVNATRTESSRVKLKNKATCEPNEVSRPVNAISESFCGTSTHGGVSRPLRNHV